ncbi:MAG: hypothetical protein KF752_02505 [Pirellulaceae bacterium]|nr:hypothetical protein [Pirellulaceae bacterium]
MIPNFTISICLKRLGWLLLSCILNPTTSAERALAEAPDWVLEAQASWSARDSQAEWVYRDRLWIGGGWMSSFEAPPRDVWSSADGCNWQLEQQSADWIHSDLPMNLVFDDRMWLLGGWHNGRLPGHSASNQVWSSRNGKSWRQVAPAAAWSPRCAGVALEHRQRMWLLGGIENYYFGNDKSLKNDIWSSADGADWTCITQNAPWSPRAYHQAVSMNGCIYVVGGGNYVPEHHALSDVWSSEDGANWTQLCSAAAWKPRIWFSAAVYRNRIWVLGGWSQESGNLGDVWHSTDGVSWQQLHTEHCWKARHEHSAFVLGDKLWIAGGHAQPLSNEVWSLSLPLDWQP